MISIRSILLILLIWFLLWFGRRLFRISKQNQYNKNINNINRQATPQQSKAMVRCEYCGVYIPEEEAISFGKSRYCCEAHRDQLNK